MERREEVVPVLGRERNNDKNTRPMEPIRGGEHVTATGDGEQKGQSVPCISRQIFWLRFAAAMDLASDVGVRHSVVLSSLEIRHLVDFSPATTSIAREIRFCVIAIVVGWTTSRVVSALLNRRSSSDQ